MSPDTSSDPSTEIATDRAPAVDDPVVAELFAAAQSVKRHAHIPYSHYPVGAALRTAAGSTYVGANIENAAYPQGWCAECSAIAAMASAGERQIETIVVVSDGSMLGTPCGGCRQKIREFATARTVIHVGGPEGIRRSYTMDELLPDSFGPENLDEFPS